MPIESQEPVAGSDSFFENELEAFKFRNEMRKRPDYAVEYPNMADLSSTVYYDRVRRNNDELADGGVFNDSKSPTEQGQHKASDSPRRSRKGRLSGLFSSNDAS